jgi:hypothetical protein
MSPSQLKSVSAPVRPMEEFIAVIFDNEVWMGLVDFKCDKSPSPEPIEHELEMRTCRSLLYPWFNVVRDTDVADLKRSSVVLIPRTFRTPTFLPVQRTTSPVREETEYDRRVESEIMIRNKRDGVGYRVGHPQPIKSAKENVKEREIRREKPSSTMLYGYKSYPMPVRPIPRRADGYTGSQSDIKAKIRSY